MYNKSQKLILIPCLLTFLLTKVSTAKSNIKDSIGFPEVEENPNLKNKENRQPVFLPSKCPVNELYYPGDQSNDWICDCRPAYIYHPKSDACWAAYQRGPCSEGQFLVLPPNSVLPVCEQNPCFVDDYVFWNGRCDRLGSSTPCAHLYPIAAALGVNATTLAIDCVRLNLETRFGDDVPQMPNIKCPLGSRRSVNSTRVPS